MSLSKPIIKVTKECKYCDNGVVRKFIDVSLSGKHRWGDSTCKYCKGIGKIDVRQDNKNFKKYYIENLEEKIDYLTTKYRNAKTETFNIGEELGKHCKELDKVVNK